MPHVKSLSHRFACQVLLVSFATSPAWVSYIQAANQISAFNVN